MREPTHQIYSIVQWYVNLWTRACANSVKTKDIDILRSPEVTPACGQVLSLPFRLNGSLNVITSLELETISSLFTPDTNTQLARLQMLRT